MGVTGWWAEAHATVTVPAAAGVVVQAYAPTIAVDGLIAIPGPARITIAAHTPTAETVIPGYPSEFLYPSEDLYPIGV